MAETRRERVSFRINRLTERRGRTAATLNSQKLLVCCPTVVDLLRDLQHENGGSTGTAAPRQPGVRSRYLWLPELVHSRADFLLQEAVGLFDGLNLTRRTQENETLGSLKQTGGGGERTSTCLLMEIS